MILALKLCMTPLLIAAATLAGRRWGPGVSGWLIGLPLTSAPVSLILALQYGPQFAARAAIGTLGGQASGCAFCLAYSLMAQRTEWPASAVTATGAFFIATFIWNHFSLALLPTFAILLVAIGVVVRLIPQRAVSVNGSHAPAWDIPARMIVATTFVMLLTTFASVLGPQLSGLISPFPVFTIVLTAFAHQQRGAHAAMSVLRGVALGSFAFACFFLTVGGLLPSLPVGWTYAAATLIAISVNGISLRLVR
jgi:hypothetical protein